MTYSSTAFLALLVHLIIHLSVILNTHYRNDEQVARSYRGMIFAVLAFYVLDALWGILYSAGLIGPVFADTELYFVAMASTLFFWTRFVIHYLKEKSVFTAALNLIGLFTLAFFGVALVLNLFLPVMFWFDEFGAYQAGALRYITLGLQILLFLSSGIYLFLTASQAEARGKTHHLAIGFFGVAMAVMVIMQAIFPLQPFYAVGCLLGTCILHTFVVNDMEEDRRLELEKMLLRQQEQEAALGSAREMAYTDSLTGVKSSHAYVETEKQVDQKIAEDTIQSFGVIVFDLNGLKEINDTKGHDAGDHYIQEACRTICRQFKHSPVFRIGGDEFVVFLDGEDYQNRRALLNEFDEQIERNLHADDVVVASGMAVFRHGHDNSFRRVFERADQRMYDRKGMLKAMQT